MFDAMEKTKQIKDYFETEHPSRTILYQLRDIVLEAGLEEDFKWSQPIYIWEGRQILGLSRFRQSCRIGFFQGGLLRDPLQVLEEVRGDKSQAMRYWTFSAPEEIDRLAIWAYVQEALSNARRGKKLFSEHPQKMPLPQIPELLLNRFSEDPHLWEAFERLSPSIKREYLQYIEEAKRESTRERRLDQIMPLIRGGQGLNDEQPK